nr:hypothetical protein [Agromyces protaetiae]
MELAQVPKQSNASLTALCDLLDQGLGFEHQLATDNPSPGSLLATSIARSGSLTPPRRVWAIAMTRLLLNCARLSLHSADGSRSALRVDLEVDSVGGELADGVRRNMRNVPGRRFSAVETYPDRSTGGFGILLGEASIEHVASVCVDLFLQLPSLVGIDAPAAIFDHDEQVRAVSVLSNEIDPVRLGESGHVGLQCAV